MASKKQSRAVSALINSAKKPRGKPFKKANPHAFKPGQSGNPAGRPKSITISEAYRKALAQPFPDDPEGRTYAEVIADEAVKYAAGGDIASAKELADRTEGRPRQMLDVDMTLRDWRALAQRNGLNEQDVLDEARRLIESAATTGGAELDS